MEDRRDLTELTAKIVAAYASANPMNTEALAGLIRSVHSALSNISSPPRHEIAREPVVSVKKSLTPEYIVCLEDGKRFKSLKRHLRTRYGMSPDEYRAKWGLPPDYPMVAPNYAMERSNLAKKMGLGRSIGQIGNGKKS